MKQSGASLSCQLNNHKWNIFGALVVAFATHLVNPYFAKYALRLGGGDMEMAYLHSLPAFLSMISLIPGALFIDIIGKQRATAVFMFVHKIFYLLMATVPFLPDTAPRGLIFVILVAFMNLPGSIYNNGFNSSLGDLFDPSERSLAIGRRNKFSEIMRIIVTILGGVVMTLPKTDSGVIQLYQVYFVVAFFVGLLEVYAYKNFIFPPIPTYKFSRDEFIHSLKFSAKFTFTNKRFLFFMFSSLFFYIGWTFGWPIFSVFTVKELGADEKYLAFFSVAAAIASVIAASFWMWLGKKMPPSKCIIYAATGMAITPITYVIFDTLETQVFCYIFSGFFIVGTTMNLLMMVLENSPSENRTTIMSIHATLVAITQTVVPILSVKMLAFITIRESLILTGILRFVGVLTLFLFFLFTKGRTVQHADDKVN
ncbi:MAG: MFS transporter [Bacillota bacterium]|nr:MFS transporter [Bacillota bacterium]